MKKILHIQIDSDKYNATGYIESIKKYLMGYEIKRDKNIVLGLNFNDDNVYNTQEVTQIIQDIILKFLNDYCDNEDNITVTCEVSVKLDSYNNQYNYIFFNEKTFFYCLPYKIDEGDYCKLTQFNINDDKCDVTFLIRYKDKYIQYFIDNKVKNDNND